MKPEHLLKLLTRFPANEYCLLEEVRDAAGHHANRSIDAIAMGLWPSRGLALHGIEVKSNRSDWIKEIKNPAKQESIYIYCDYFWLFATNEEVAFEREIPKTWGYMLIKGNKLVTIKDAPILKPKPVEKTFLAAMLKRASNGLVNPATLADQIEAAYKRGINERDFKNDIKISSYDRLEEVVKKFEAASGVMIDKAWKYSDRTPEEVGQALRLILDADDEIEGVKSKLEWIRTQLKYQLNGIEQFLNNEQLKQTNGTTNLNATPGRGV